VRNREETQPQSRYILSVNTSTAVTGYIAALFLVGLGMAIVGTLLPLGGGITIMAIGAASIGSGLVLVGIRIMSGER